MNHLLEYKNFLLENIFEPNEKTYDELRNKIFYHNTTIGSKKNILNNGFSIHDKVRGKIYGEGIYFTMDEPNNRWGKETIKVKLNPQKILYDIKGEIEYEDNPIGKEVLKYASYPLKNKPSDYEEWAKALNKMIADKKYDSLITEEFETIIAVVFDPDIISIIE